MKIKNLLSITGILAVALILFAFKNNTAQIDSTVQEVNWENLKVLPKDISEDNLKTLMRGYNKALGVKCNFCHADGKEEGKLDFVSDSKKEKEYARHMIVMTQKLNAENFNWDNSPEPENITVVTCMMCHRGNHSATESIKKMELK